MSSLPERYYRFGSTTVKLVAPPFPESDQLKQFSAAPGKEDVVVRLTPVSRLRLPSGELRREGETDWYWSPDGRTALVKRYDGTPLWTAEYSDDGSVSAEYPADGPALSSFVVLEMARLPRLLLRRGAVVLHSSFIAVDGGAVLFTALKQVGKSTQAELWRKHAGALIVNGDRALIEWRNGAYRACGCPFSGTSGICLNGDYPLRAVVTLSQSAENSVRRAGPGEALRALISGCSLDGGDARETELFLSVAERIALSVPFFALSCTPDERAVDCLKKALSSGL